MSQTTALPRQTRYCTEIKAILKASGHATNAQILLVLRKSYPDLSATTVHRATTRLAHRGYIAIAPPAKDGSMQYDTNTNPHDHFQCQDCGITRDTDIKDKIIPLLKNSMNDCDISGRLIITGTCKQCVKKEGVKT
jgi:Fur family peroxide stress response transcriptional regulator